jgi:hypothetical protein
MFATMVDGSDTFYFRHKACFHTHNCRLLYKLSDNTLADLYLDFIQENGIRSSF